MILAGVRDIFLWDRWWMFPASQAGTKGLFLYLSLMQKWVWIFSALGTPQKVWKVFEGTMEWRRDLSLRMVQ